MEHRRASPGPPPPRPAGCGQTSPAAFPPGPPVDRWLDTAVGSRADGLRHVERVPGRAGRPVPWPAWVPPTVLDRLGGSGIARPWQHQVAAAELARAGTSVVVATGTASGKSLAYLLPVLSAVAEHGDRPHPPTALYLAPTKALAADQLRVLRALAVEPVRAATYDGDTDPDERDWVRAHANVVLTNPDMLHHALLPGHERWSGFLRGLRYVVVDECHAYRGVFGSHVAQVLRRLRRVCAHHGGAPTFVLASATVSAPELTAERLTGVPVRAVTDDGSPRAETVFALYEPPLTDGYGEHAAPLRRSATAVAADILADLVADGARTLTFVGSRRGAETVATTARRLLADAAPELADRVAAYRAGFLPEERRALEQALQRGRLLGVATTSALELGVDIAGLDAVVLAGYPGTLTALWQRAGRAGRAGQAALAVLVARDDPLDTYVVHHPAAVFGRAVEAAVLDPDNPYVLAPHLCAAAAELPLTDADAAVFGPAMADVLPRLARGLLRQRPTGWFWASRERASALADLRGVGGSPVRVVEQVTGRLLGTVDAGAAHSTVHAGAVYVHQGAPFLVRHLDTTDAVALVTAGDPGYTTTAREVSDIAVVATEETRQWAGGAVTVHFGTVDVTRQVVAFLKRRTGSGEVLGEEPLDLPPRQLRTKAVWWTVSPEVLDAAGIAPRQLPGAAHAAEHAAIGLLPLYATCDRWDIGGVSTAAHPDTGRPSVFVYDGQPGGAGFAERGYRALADWLTATLGAIDSCGCPQGCPSCVQSPKCGNGNEPLDKATAARLLRAVLARRPCTEVPADPAVITLPEPVSPAGRSVLAAPG